MTVERSIVEIHRRNGWVMTGWIYHLDEDGTAWVVTSDALGKNPAESIVKVRVHGDREFVTGYVVKRSTQEPMNLITICCDRSWQALTIADSVVSQTEAEFTLFGYELAAPNRATFGKRSLMVASNKATAGNVRYRVVRTPNDIGEDKHGPYIGGPIVDTFGEVQGMMTTYFRWHFNWRYVADASRIRSLVDSYDRKLWTRSDPTSDKIRPSLLQVFSNSSFARVGSVSTGWIFQVDADGSALVLTAHNPFREALYDYLGARFEGEESWRAGEIVAYDASLGITVFKICCNSDWKPLALTQATEQHPTPSSFAFGLKQVHESNPYFYDSRFAYVPLDLSEDETTFAADVLKVTSMTPSFAGSPVLNRSSEVVGMVANQDAADGSDRRILSVEQLNDFMLKMRTGDGIVFTNIARPELPPNYKFIVGEGVSQADRHQLERAASNLHEYALFAGIPVTDESKTIYIHHDRNALTEVFVTVEGWRESDAQKYWQDSAPPGGTASINEAFYLVDEALPEGEHQYTPWIVDGHEVVHGMYQFGLAGLHTDREWFKQHHGQSPPWMGEGVAMVLQQLAFCHANSVPYLHNPWDKAATLKWSGTLEDIDGHEPEEWGSVYKYKAGAEAIELLVTIVGVSRLLDFYTLMQPREPWQSTFRRAYGISVEEFYERFKQHRAAGLPDLELPIRVEPNQ